MVPNDAKIERPFDWLALAISLKSHQLKSVFVVIKALYNGWNIKSLFVKNEFAGENSLWFVPLKAIPQRLLPALLKIRDPCPCFLADHIAHALFR